jgi:hypothetical protein
MSSKTPCSEYHFSKNNHLPRFHKHKGVRADRPKRPNPKLQPGIKTHQPGASKQLAVLPAALPHRKGVRSIGQQFFDNLNTEISAAASSVSWGAT